MLCPVPYLLPAFQLLERLKTAPVAYGILIKTNSLLVFKKQPGWNENKFYSHMFLFNLSKCSTMDFTTRNFLET